MDTKTILYCLLLLAAFSSCKVERANRCIHAAQPANTLFLKEKGDSKVSGHVYADGVLSDNYGYSLQAAYAVTNHWAVMANYSNKKEKQVYGYDTMRFQNQSWFTASPIVQTNFFDSSRIDYSRTFAELAIGYMFFLNKQKTLTYNLYIGGGAGKSKINDNGLDSNSIPYNRAHQLNISKAFLQGAFNYMPTNEIAASIGGKLSLFSFKQNSSSYSKEERNYFYLDKIANYSQVLWEPFICVEFGHRKLDWLKANMQASFCTALSNEYPKVKSTSLSFGLCFDVAKIFTATKETK